MSSSPGAWRRRAGGLGSTAPGGTAQAAKWRSVARSAFELGSVTPPHAPGKESADGPELPQEDWSTRTRQGVPDSHAGSSTCVGRQDKVSKKSITQTLDAVLGKRSMHSSAHVSALWLMCSHS